MLKTIENGKVLLGKYAHVTEKNEDFGRMLSELVYVITTEQNVNNLSVALSMAFFMGFEKGKAAQFMEAIITAEPMEEKWIEDGSE